MNFFQRHFEVVESLESLIPTFREGGITFNVKRRVVQKHLNLLDKLSFYVSDFSIWLMERCRSRGQVQ